MGGFTGATGPPSQTGFGDGGGGSSGILQPATAPQQSSLSGMANFGSNNYSRTSSLFSGMQSGSGGFTPPSQANQPMMMSSSSGAGSGSGGTSLFGGMQVNNMQANQGGGVGGGMLQPLAPMQQQPTSTQSIGSASTGWSPNINKRQHQMNSAYSASQPQSQPAGGGWSSNIAGGSSMVGSGTAGGGGWSQNIAQGGSGMGMQRMPTGMGHSQMQSGMGIGQGSFGGGGATWSTNITGGGRNTGYPGASAPPTAAGLMMGGMGQPLVSQSLQPQQQQQQTSSKPAPGANPFADLSFLG